MRQNVPRVIILSLFMLLLVVPGLMWSIARWRSSSNDHPLTGLYSPDTAIADIQSADPHRVERGIVTLAWQASSLTESEIEALITYVIANDNAVDLNRRTALVA